MKVEQDTVAAFRSPSVKAPSATPLRDWAASSHVAALLKSLNGSGPRYVACAPLRLDLMGGSASYSGCLSLSTPIDEHVYLGVQPRNDGMFSVVPTSTTERNGGKPIAITLDALPGARSLVRPADTRSTLAEDAASFLLAMLAVWREEGEWGGLNGGLTISFGPPPAIKGDLGWNGALCASLAACVSALHDSSVDVPRAIEGFRRLGMRSERFPIATPDFVSALSARGGSVTQVRMDPCSAAGHLRLPDDLVFVGVDCGMVADDIAARHHQVRVSVMMGQTLIDRIIRHDGLTDLQWDGLLSRISISDFVERFRDRIPTKITGRAFLEKFSDAVSADHAIEPNVVYRVRSRTEHHIYEHDRAMKLGECIARMLRTTHQKALEDAAELLHASQWSYGQRCGIGSVATDTLVQAIRKRAESAEIYGAKITGSGCGGVVAVLMRSTEQAYAALQDAMDAYQSHTGHTPTMLKGSGNGVLANGVRAF